MDDSYNDPDNWNEWGYIPDQHEPSEEGEEDEEPVKADPDDEYIEYSDDDLT